MPSERHDKGCSAAGRRSSKITATSRSTRSDVKQQSAQEQQGRENREDPRFSYEGDSSLKCHVKQKNKRRTRRTMASRAILWQCSSAQPTRRLSPPLHRIPIPSVLHPPQPSTRALLGVSLKILRPPIPPRVSIRLRNTLLTCSHWGRSRARPLAHGRKMRPIACSK